MYVCITNSHNVVLAFLQNGLGRLAEAASTIDQLSQQAQVQRSLLAHKQDEADRALADIQVGRLYCLV